MENRPLFVFPPRGKFRQYFTFNLTRVHVVGTNHSLSLSGDAYGYQPAISSFKAGTEMYLSSYPLMAKEEFSAACSMFASGVDFQDSGSYQVETITENRVYTSMQMSMEIV